MSDILINQIAIRVPNISRSMDGVRNLFNKAESIHNDSLKMDGVVNGGAILHNVPLELGFIFDLAGVEIEFINSDCDFHWHSEIVKSTGTEFFLSHLGSYCSLEQMDYIVKYMYDRKINIIQETISHSHSTKRDNGENRQYKDLIFDSEDLLGFRLKLSAHCEAKK